MHECRFRAGKIYQHLKVIHHLLQVIHCDDMQGIHAAYQADILAQVMTVFQHRRCTDIDLPVLNRRLDQGFAHPATGAADCYIQHNSYLLATFADYSITCLYYMSSRQAC